MLESSKVSRLWLGEGVGRGPLQLGKTQRGVLRLIANLYLATQNHRLKNTGTWPSGDCLALTCLLTQLDMLLTETMSRTNLRCKALLAKTLGEQTRK